MQSEHQSSKLPFDPDAVCDQCGNYGLHEVEGGGGVMTWLCPRCAAEIVWIMNDDGEWERATPSADSDTALRDLTGGPVEPIILTPGERAEVEAVLAHVARTGHQP